MASLVSSIDNQKESIQISYRLDNAEEEVKINKIWVLIKIKFVVFNTKEVHENEFVLSLSSKN